MPFVSVPRRSGGKRAAQPKASTRSPSAHTPTHATLTRKRQAPGVSPGRRHAPLPTSTDLYRLLPTSQSASTSSGNGLGTAPGEGSGGGGGGWNPSGGS